MRTVIDTVAWLLFIAAMAYPLHSITQWDLRSFRAGFVFSRSTQPFQLPSHFPVGQLIFGRKVDYKFVSHNICLLRESLPVFRRGNILRSTLLIEVQIEPPNALIIARYPWSYVISFVMLYLAGLWAALRATPHALLLTTMGLCTAVSLVVILVPLALTLEGASYYASRAFQQLKESVQW